MYRRRRIFALVVVVLLVIGVWAGVSAVVNWVGGLFGGTSASNPTSSPSINNGAIPACNGADIQVNAYIGDGSSPKTTFASGDIPMLWFSVTNNGAGTCQLNLGAKAQIFTITSGNETIWTSGDCNRDGLTDAPMALNSGELKSSTPSAWFKVRSTTSGGCGEDQAKVTTGGASYHLKVSVGGFTSNDVQFILN